MKRIFMKVWDVQNGSAVLPSILFVSACFVIGAVAGCVTAAYGGNETELASAASEYTALAQLSFGGVFLKLLQYPLVLFFCGICAFGAAIIPIVVAVRGFFLSFAMTTFMRLFGGAGLLYSAALFGIQCLMMLPCIFIIAAQGLISSSLLFSLSSGRGKKISESVFSGAYFIRVLVCFLVILLCAVAETYITPTLVSIVTQNVLP